MYVCYVDESGHTGEKLDPNQPVEVVCGVLTDITKLFKTQRELSELMQVLKDKGISVDELKARQVYGGRGSWKNVDGDLRHDIFEILLKWAIERKCKFIICPIDSKKFFDAKKNNCAYSKLLKHPYEAGAINVTLAIQRAHGSKKNNKGKTFIIFDEQAKHDKHVGNLVTKHIHHFDDVYGFSPSPRLKYQPERLDAIVDVPLFSKSNASILIQVADMVAFVVNQYLKLKVYDFEESYTGEKKRIGKWYKTIGDNVLAHTAIDPPGKDASCVYFRDIRPDGWSAKSWVVS